MSFSLALAENHHPFNEILYLAFPFRFPVEKFYCCILLVFVMRLFFQDPTLANTGAAFRYVLNNVFNTEYDRPNAKNVLHFVTDQLADDDVAAAAKELRDSGVTVRRILQLIFQ